MLKLDSLFFLINFLASFSGSVDIFIKGFDLIFLIFSFPFFVIFLLILFSDISWDKE